VKILHYIPNYAPAWSFGGPVRSVSTLCEELARQGHDVTVFTTNAGLEGDPAIPTDHPLERNGVTVRYFPRLKGYGIRSPALEEAVEKGVAEFDLVHMSAIWQPTASAAHRAARRCGIPLIMSPRGALGPYVWRRHRFRKLAYFYLFERTRLKRISGFHYTSHQEARESERYRYGRPQCVIPNGIDANHWRRDEQAGAAWRTAQGIGRDEWMLLYAGRLHHKKGLDLLPEALAIVRQTKPQLRLRLVLVGPNEDGTLATMETQMMRLRPGVGMNWVPILSERALPAAYSAADLFLLPSRHENFGNAAIEALACGCPALVSAETACVEVAGGLGLEAVALRTGKAWGEAILALIGRERGAVSPAARISLLERVGLSASAKAMSLFYERFV
jgi:glycosyltransferase involved in cell wall biosynthesis